MRKLTEKEIKLLQQLKGAEKDRSAFLLFETGLLLIFVGVAVKMPRWLEILDIAAAFGLFISALVRHVLVSAGKAEPKPTRYAKIIFSVQVAVFLLGMLLIGIIDSDTTVIVLAAVMLAMNIASLILK